VTTLSENKHTHISSDSEPQKDSAFNPLDLNCLAWLAIISIIAGLIFFTGLGGFPLFNPDEALYAEPAREMLETGNWMTTYLNYAVRFTKPPLCIWMMAISYQIFGVNEFAARFFGAACATIIVAITYLYIRKFVSNRAAVCGALSLVVAPLFFGTAREAITDMPLTLFIAGALMAFHRAFTAQRWSFCLLAYVLLGLAVMTKGPVAIVLPALVLFAYHFLRGNLISALKFYKPWFGAAIVAAISLPWFIGEIAITKGAYFREFILRENLQRFTGVVDQHKGGPLYHVVAMFGGYLPWSVFLPQALVGAFILPGKKLLSRYRELTPSQDVALFASCFALITLAFFTASVSKLLPYTLPAFPALAILIALELEKIFSGFSIKRLLVPCAVLGIAYGACGLAAPHLAHAIRHLPNGIMPIAGGYLSFQSLLMVLVLALVVLRRSQAAITVFTIGTILSSSYFASKALPIVSQEFEGPIPAFSTFAGASGEAMFVYKVRKPSIPFYAHRATVLSPNQEFLTTTVEEEVPRHASAYIIAKKKDSGVFLNQPGYKLVKQEGQYCLLHWRKSSQ
jgi:4-amino-4-deoxy-L-arabinose transferase-like glycosyltransferase